MGGTGSRRGGIGAASEGGRQTAGVRPAMVGCGNRNKKGGASQKEVSIGRFLSLRVNLKYGIFSKLQPCSNTLIFYSRFWTAERPKRTGRVRVRPAVSAINCDSIWRKGFRS